MAKRRAGQIPFSPTEEQRELVAVLAGAGIPHLTICRFITWPATAGHDAGKPIVMMTLRKCFRYELNEGMAHSNAKIVKTAHEMIVKDKNPALTIFWLKTRMGWKEPAQEVNLSMSYGQLVEQAVKQAAGLIAQKMQQQVALPEAIEGEAKAA
jgi:hypothetical protein